MKTLKIAFAVAMMAATQTTMAGGLLTNTNQNVAFLRNPARDAAIGIDGVYSNPAGVIFLGDGLYISLNLQSAHQTRTVKTGFPLFPFNAKAPGNSVHEYEGTADAPIIPSVQAAYNKGRWSLQFGAAITGGGGKCEFDGGLGSFEQVVAGLGLSTISSLAAPGGLLPDNAKFSGYEYDSYMRGRQYYYGFTAGAAYKITDNFSFYGGLRLLYGSANYYGYVKDIIFKADIPVSETQSISKEIPVNQEISLNCDQTGWGVAPIIGVDYKAGRLNLAAKYEFKTRMRLKNKSANSDAAKGIPMLDKYADGGKVAEDSPALLTVGAQYELLPSLRINAGWHHYFDVDTKQYTKDMLGDSNEYLFGAEYDICKNVQVSAGAQRTAYAMKDAGMNDISFNVSSWSYGLGVGVKVSDKVKVNAAWFQTLYDDYDMTSGTAPAVTTNSFTRTNRVLGLGVDLTL